MHLLQNPFSKEHFDIYFLQKCLNFHLVIGGKVRHFVTLYRFPNKSLNEFNPFIKNLELNLDEMENATTLTMQTQCGNFNTQKLSWFCNDKSNFEGTKTDKITLQTELHQIIKNPTHILHNSSSCIGYTTT